MLKDICFLILFHYGTAIALMGLTFFHLLKGFACKRQNKFFRFNTD